MLTDDELTDYVLGELPPGRCRDVERELAASPSLRQRYVALTESLGWVAASVEALRPPPSLRQRVLDSLDQPNPLFSYCNRIAALFDLAGSEVEQILRRATAPGHAGWETSGLAGVSYFHLTGGPGVSGSDCGFVRLASGAAFPTQRHEGDEWTLILQGSLIDHEERRYEPGDVIHAQSGSVHSFHNPGPGDLMFAVVLHGGLHFVP